MKKYNLFLWLACIFLVGSCEQANVNPTEETAIEEIKNSARRLATPTDDLNDRADMPFTLNNMQNAYESLVRNPTAFRGDKPSQLYRIQPTHIYCKFTTPDSQSVALLLADTVIDLSEEPLTHKEVETPSILPEHEWTALDDQDENYIDAGGMVYYATVSINHELPDVPYTILDYFYFPPDDLDETKKDASSEFLSNYGGTDVLEMMEIEAMKLTNNLAEEDMDGLGFVTHKGTDMSFSEATNSNEDISSLQIDYSNFESRDTNGRRRRWTCEGWLTFEDDVLNDGDRVQPLMGVWVKARKWGFLVIAKGHTNRDGYYYAGRPRTRFVKYAVHFQHKDLRYKVMAENRFIQAKHRDFRRYRRRGFNHHFTTNRRSHFYAMICNATYDYITRAVSQHGLFSPQRPFNRNIELVAKYWQNTSSRFIGDIGVLPYIRITRIRNGSYRGSDGIYATTTHELTHAGHYEEDQGFFFNFHGDRKQRVVMRESWAEAVEAFLTNERYFGITPTYRPSNAALPIDILWNDVRQRLIVGALNQNSPFVTDLMDTRNQFIESPNFPVDRVSGYTLRQLQETLNHSRSLNDWRSKLINRYNNPTEIFIDDAFSYARVIADNL